MNNTVKVLEIIMPIFVTIALGVFAKKTNKISEEVNKGLQQFVMTFCLPCVLFNSCLTGSFGMESVTAMVLVMPLILLSSLWSFKVGKKGIRTTTCRSYFPRRKQACWVSRSL